MGPHRLDPRLIVRLPLALLVAAIVAAGCSSTDPETAQRLEAARSQSEELGTGGDALADATPEQLACVEEEADGFGLQEGLSVMTDPGLQGDHARHTLFSAIIECIPNLGELDSFADVVATNVAVSIGAAADVDDIEARCIVSYVLDNAADPAEALGAGRSQDSIDTFISSFEACLDEESYAVVTGAPGTGAQAYGDDPLLDALFDQCNATDERACDLLFLSTSPGSEYNDLALDCAGRGDGVTYCYSKFATTDTGEVDPASPGMDVLDAECVAGDMLACDLLYMTAQLGSDYERTGFSCGGRIVGAIPNCRTRFPEG